MLGAVKLSAIEAVSTNIANTLFVFIWLTEGLFLTGDVSYRGKQACVSLVYAKLLSKAKKLSISLNGIKTLFLTAP